MVNLNNKYLYAKGTANVVVRNIVTGDVDYQSNKIQTSQFTTTCDMGAIQAGIGNATVIQIPHNCAANLTLTNADFSMSARAMQVGSALMYNSVVPTCEVVTGAAGKLTVTQTASAPYGYDKKICNVVEAGATNAAGTAYEINDTKEVVGFTAENGKNYLVTYFTTQGNASYFNVGSVFSPAIKHVTIQIAVYSTAGTANALSGTKVGDLYIIIPRMQFSGKADTDGSQTAASTTSMEGIALTYDEATAAGATCDDAIPNLARVLYVPASNNTDDVIGLVVVGGLVSLPVSSSAQIPVQYMMKGGTLSQPDYSTMTYSIPTQGATYASVSNTGLITSTATTGDTTCTITLTAKPEIKTVVQVSVTSA